VTDRSVGITVVAVVAVETEGTERDGSRRALPLGRRHDYSPRAMRWKNPLSSLRLLGLLAASTTLLATHSLGAAEMHLVYCDVERTIAEVDEGREARKVIDKEQQKREHDIAAREAEIKRLQDELERQAKAFSKGAIERKAAEIQQAFSEYQQVLAKYNKELQDKDHQFFDPIDHRLKALLQTIAFRDGYDMILSKRSVPYGRKDLDVTDKIILEYNKTYPVTVVAAPSGKGGKAPKSAPSDAPPRAPKMK
jgi:outer membrane protein